MNRQIKFRVWDDISNKMHSNMAIRNNLLSDFDLDHYSLMQYTGLKDKDGKEIYEGDLISNGSGRVCKIVWHNHAAQWDYTPINLGGDSLFFNSRELTKCCNVIGNIYENPYLL